MKTPDNELKAQVKQAIKALDSAESYSENSALNSTGIKIILAGYNHPKLAEAIKIIERYEKSNPAAQINSAGAKVILNELLRD